MKYKIPKDVTNIMQSLIAHGFDAYLIGGCCRDWLFNEYHGTNYEPHDFDLFTNASGESLQNIFPNHKIIGGEERQKKVLTIIVEGNEVSQYRCNGDRTATKLNCTLEEHQATCDFTINSLAMDMNGNIFDSQNGEKDIENKILKFVGNAEDRIEEDPLRILRGLRFRLKYGLTTCQNTNQLEFISEPKNLPKERIREELLKILSENDLHKHSLNILEEYFPRELHSPTMFLGGGKHHNECPWAHCNKSFLTSSKLTTNPLLRLATLLHDVGKAITRSEENDEIHFYQHHKASEDITRKWMETLKFPQRDIEYVCAIVRNHMHGYNDEIPTKKSFIKLFNYLDRHKVPIEDFVVQLYCDHQGNLAKKKINFLEFLKGNKYYKKYYEFKYTNEPFNIGDLEIKGSDLIENGYSQGPEMGRVLNCLFDEVMSCKINNVKQELIMRVREIKEKQ